MKSEDECESIFNTRLARFESVHVKKGTIGKKARKAIVLTKQSHVLRATLKEIEGKLLNQLAQTPLEYAISIYERGASQSTVGAPSVSLKLEELRRRAYEFMRWTSDPTTASVHASQTVRECLNEYFEQEHETDRQLIGIIVGQLMELQKYRVTQMGLIRSETIIIEIYRMLLCGGIWNTTGSEIERRERSDKLRDLGMSVAAEAINIPGLDILIAIADWIKVHDPNEIPDAFKKAQAVEEYFEKYIGVLKNWISSAEMLRRSFDQEEQAG